MKVPARALLALLLGLSTSAQATTWEMDGARSSLRFVGEAQGEAFEGRFDVFSARITFDPAQLDASNFEVSVPLRSADTQNAERDELLHSEEFFDSPAQDDAVYRATRFERLEGARFRALGALTLKGKTHPVALDFSWSASGLDATLEGTAMVSRLAFDIGTGDWTDTDMIGDTVKVETTVRLRARAPDAGPVETPTAKD